MSHNCKLDVAGSGRVHQPCVDKFLHRPEYKERRQGELVWCAEGKYPSVHCGALLLSLGSVSVAKIETNHEVCENDLIIILISLGHREYRT